MDDLGPQGGPILRLIDSTGIFVLEVIDDHVEFEPDPRRWSLQEYPEEREVVFETAVNPSTDPADGLDFIVTIRSLELEARWYAIFYEGAADPMAHDTGGTYWQPTHWVWRVTPFPVIQPQLIELQGDVVLVRFTSNVQRPDVPAEVVTLTETNVGNCVPDFRGAVSNAVYFQCASEIAPPATLVLEIRDGLTAVDGTIVPPVRFAVPLEGQTFSFPLHAPPPLPASRCAEGQRYSPLDCTTD